MYSFPLEELQDMMTKVESLDPTFYNVRAVELLVQSIIHEEQTKRYFRQGGVIGYGSYGVAILIDVAKIKALAVVKAHYDSSDKYIVEYTINKKLNELREEIPNFVYTYGIFLGSSPWR